MIANYTTFYQRSNQVDISNYRQRTVFNKEKIHSVLSALKEDIQT